MAVSSLVSPSNFSPLSMVSISNEIVSKGLDVLSIIIHTISYAHPHLVKLLFIISSWVFSYLKLIYDMYYTLGQAMFDNTENYLDLKVSGLFRFKALLYCFNLTV